MWRYTRGGDIEKAFGIQAENNTDSLQKEREANSKGLSVLMDAVKFLSRQNLALRGHDESDESKNKGKFLYHACNTLI